MRAGRLNALEVTRATRARRRGKLADGNGLYLVHGASWVFRYAFGGRERFMGLGAVDLVTLAEARLLAHGARRQIARNIDPLDERAAAKATPTFAALAREHIAAHKAGWSERHAEQTERALARDAYPVIGACGSMRSMLTPCCGCCRDCGPSIRSARIGCAAKS